MDFRPFRRRFGCAVAVPTLISLAGNCNRAGTGSAATGTSDSTVRTAGLGLACALAAENAATVRIAPARTDIRTEVWETEQPSLRLSSTMIGDCMGYLWGRANLPRNGVG